LILNCQHWLNAPNVNFKDVTYCFNVVNLLNNIEIYDILSVLFRH